MTQAFSKLLHGTEGRYLTAVEEERATIGALEMRQRIVVSRLIAQSEYSIVDYATHAFCDIIPGFDGPKGSVRRKKGHQDGRIFLRYIAQGVREGSAEIFFEKVLSWLVGHLDERNVGGEYMEIFVHFIHQGVRREIPEGYHGFVDPIFEEVVGFIRRSSHCGVINRAHRRIADLAVERVMDILPDVKAQYGVSSLPKCKRDFELLIKEVARLLKAPSAQAQKEQFAGWLIDRLMNQVAYDHKVWHWSFLALREAVVKCCGSDAGAQVSDLFETMADHSKQLVQAVELATAASDIANECADQLIEMGEPLGLLRKDEFKTNVTMVNRELVTRLAALSACGSVDAQLESLSEIWCDEVIAKMPSDHTRFLASNLKVLLEAAKKYVGEETAAAFHNSVMQLVAVARRTETAGKLAQVADDISHQISEWVFDTLGISATAARACYRDVRLALARVVSLLPAGPSSVNGYQFRKYLAQYVLPHFCSTQSEPTYRRIAELIGEHLEETDAKLARTYFEDAIPAFERWSRMSAIHNSSSDYSEAAVERGYQADPRHESMRRHGIEAGQRDGRFLLEKTVLAAVVSGDQAQEELHAYFRNEQIRLSKLPGGIVVEFVRGLQEQVRDFPEVVDLLVSLAKAAPAYTTALKLQSHHAALAEHISKQTLKSAPGYRERIGENGLEACIRDNSVMIRGLAHHMQTNPLDVSSFKEWWMRRIGTNIRNRPETSDTSEIFSMINSQSLLSAMQESFDQEELNYCSAYLSRVIEAEGEGSVFGKQTLTPAIGGFANPNAAPTISFADIG